MTHIREPSNTDGVWKVIISKSRSPLSEIEEVIECSNREDAWDAYYGAKRETGEAL